MFNALSVASLFIPYWSLNNCMLLATVNVYVEIVVAVRFGVFIPLLSAESPFAESEVFPTDKFPATSRSLFVDNFPFAVSPPFVAVSFPSTII